MPVNQTNIAHTLDQFCKNKKYITTIPESQVRSAPSTGHLLHIFLTCNNLTKTKTLHSNQIFLVNSTSQGRQQPLQVELHSTAEMPAPKSEVLLSALLQLWHSSAPVLSQLCGNSAKKTPFVFGRFIFCWVNKWIQLHAQPKKRQIQHNAGGESRRQ